MSKKYSPLLWRMPERILSTFSVMIEARGCSTMDGSVIPGADCISPTEVDEVEGLEYRIPATEGSRDQCFRVRLADRVTEVEIQGWPLCMRMSMVTYTWRRMKRPEKYHRLCRMMRS